MLKKCLKILLNNTRETWQNKRRQMHSIHIFIQDQQYSIKINISYLKITCTYQFNFQPAYITPLAYPQSGQLLFSRIIFLPSFLQSGHSNFLAEGVDRSPLAPCLSSHLSITWTSFKSFFRTQHNICKILFAENK